MKNKLMSIAGDMIENEDLREVYNAILEEMPEYIATVPASSSGKYHPIQDLGEGGLCRHMYCVGKLIDWKLQLEYYRTRFTSRERDCMRIAGLVHDGRKSGEENSGHTVHEHPLLMQKAIIDLGLRKFPRLITEISIIANLVLTHMGQWNESGYSDVVLPKPQTEMEMIVHEADFLSSRKECTLMIPDVDTAE